MNNNYQSPVQWYTDAYFFDFHGTISSYTFWCSLDEEKYNVIQQCIFSGNNGILEKWMRDEYSFHDVVYLVESITGISRNTLFKYAIGGDEKLISENILEQIQVLRRNGKVFLVSDNMDILVRAFNKIKLYRYFDDIWFSCENRALKNSDKGISYRQIFEKFQLQPSRCLLFDDSYSSIKVFNGLGGLGARVKNPEETWSYLLRLNKTENEKCEYE